MAILYRLVNKKLLRGQIQLIDVACRVLERIMQGMTFEFAVTRVFELEEKKAFYINRVKMSNYLQNLLLGLAKLFREQLPKDKQDISIDTISKVDIGRYIDFSKDKEYADQYSTMVKNSKGKEVKIQDQPDPESEEEEEESESDEPEPQPEPKDLKKLS